MAENNRLARRHRPEFLFPQTMASKATISSRTKIEYRRGMERVNRLETNSAVSHKRPSQNAFLGKKTESILLYSNPPIMTSAMVITMPGTMWYGEPGKSERFEFIPHHPMGIAGIANRRRRRRLETLIISFPSLSRTCVPFC